MALAVGLVAAPPTVPEVEAAAPDLTIVTDARYDVQPEQHRVRVNLKLVLTNHLKDTVTKRYFFDQAFLAVLPNTSGFKFTWEGSGTPEVHVSKKTSDYTLLRLDLGQRIFSGKSATYNLRFDMVDPGGEPTRDVRVGETLVSFPVWAFATDSTPGGSVKVVFPSGFEVDVEAGEIPAPITNADGQVIFQTEELDKPLTFFAYLVGDRPGAYAERSEHIVVDGAPVTLTIRSWPDDPEWSARVGDLVTRAAGPRARDRSRVAARRRSASAARRRAARPAAMPGCLTQPRGSIEVAYYAEDFVVLHEAAHAWFNGGLLADRWANEAFASYYGLEVAEALGLRSRRGDADARADRGRQDPAQCLGPDRSRVDGDRGLRLRGDARPGQGDRASGRTRGAATCLGRRRRWDRSVSAAEPAGAGSSGSAATSEVPEAVDGPPDWRGLLDLLEAHDTDAYDDLWTHVGRSRHRPAA